MNELELEIFGVTTDYSEVRLKREGRSHVRRLNRAVIDALIESVDRSYSLDSPGARVFGSAQLRELGERLYGFVDGEERWFGDMLTDPRGIALRITADEKRLRHLPWELVARNGTHLCGNASAPFLPIRAASQIAAVAPDAPQNRPLRVLFMATSPEGVEPVLSYEAEEAGILAATADTGTDLVVEESGTLEGLRFTAESYGTHYFDALHLSGHATVDEGQPKFVVENEFGRPALVTADHIAAAMAGQWPRIVFVSGCLTGGAPDGGVVPSMSESLVRAGAPMVLGWALPVGDISASRFAADLYRALAAGHRIDRSVVEARRQLYAAHSANWHLLRVYSDKSPLTPIVTPLNAPGRERLRVRQAEVEFLDPETRVSRVASRADFVGRRRTIQRCLQILNKPHGSPGGAHALVLHGMGGLGKSTLASRLLERMPTHQRAVWFGRVDLTKFRDLSTKVTFESMSARTEADLLLDNDQVDLAVRLRYLLDGPLGRTPCLFVFDDFEHGNLDERDGGHVLSADMAQILPALLSAIEATNSRSRALITSRYRFPIPAGTAIRFEGLETLTDVEQTKKVANLPNLSAATTSLPEISDRAVHAAAGNPRLLDWLDKVVAVPNLDVDSLMVAIESEADAFRRENIFAEKLLASQRVDLRKMLAKLDVVELPMPAAAVYAIHDHPDAASHVKRAVDLGLLEEGTDPLTNEPQYFVSNVLHPLLRPLITDIEYVEACGAAARSLYENWVTS